MLTAECRVYDALGPYIRANKPLDRTAAAETTGLTYNHFCNVLCRLKAAGYIVRDGEYGSFAYTDKPPAHRATQEPQIAVLPSTFIKPPSRAQLMAGR